MRRRLAIGFCVSIRLALAGTGVSAPGKLPVWEDDYTLNTTNDVEAAGDSLGFIASDHGHLYRTEDRGKTWAPVAVPTDVAIYGVTATATGGVYARIDQGYMFSFDAGRSWEPPTLLNKPEFAKAGVPAIRDGITEIGQVNYGSSLLSLRAN
jgi:hypothetical protein